MEDYLALAKTGRAEIIEKKSRFIGCAVEADSEAAAAADIEATRKEHYAARHVCFAYLVGAGRQPLLRFSDDGEPQGTAGKPILEVIQGSGVRNVCITVTRYFGGTLLGTGGLVRAYTEAARSALQAAELRMRRQMTEAALVLDYADLGKIQHVIGQTDGRILDTEYTDRVILRVLIYTPVYPAFQKAVREATGGRVEAERTGERYD